MSKSLMERHLMGLTVKEAKTLCLPRSSTVNGSNRTLAQFDLTLRWLAARVWGAGRAEGHDTMIKMQREKGWLTSPRLTIAVGTGGLI
jgi:hypothetical protein